MAPQFFESGKVAIEVAMHNFTCWDPIEPGKSYQVPLLGQVCQQLQSVLNFKNLLTFLFANYAFLLTQKSFFETVTFFPSFSFNHF